MARSADPERDSANYALGVAGEAGEVADLLKKHLFHGHTLDLLELEKELGDVLWYVAALATQFGLSLDGVMDRNVEKLIRRYPSGFTCADSLHREDR